MTYTRKVVVGFIVVSLCTFLANAFGYLLRLILVRSLTPVEYGLLYAVLGLFGFISFAQTLGLNDAIVQQVPSLKDPVKVKSTFLTVVYTQLAVTGVILLLAVLLSRWLSINYFHDSAAAPLVVIYALSVLVSPIELSIIALFQGLGKVEWYGYMMLMRAAALFGFALLFLRLGMGVFAPVVAYVCMYAVIPLIYLPLLLKWQPSFKSAKASYDPALLRKLLRIGVPVILSSTIGIFLTYVDVFFITLYRTIEEVALYNVALPTASLLWFVSGVIYAIMLQVSSEMDAKCQRDVLKDAMGVMYLYLLILLLPCTVVLLLFPELIINTLFSGRYIAAASTLQVLALCTIFITLANLNSSVLIGLGKPLSTTRAMVAAAIVNVIGDIILIPRLGIIGSAYATLVAFIVLFIVNTHAVRTLVRFRFPYGKAFRLIIAAAFFAAGVFWLRNALDLPLWWKVIAALVTGGLFYVALLFILRVVSFQDIGDLKRLLKL